MQASTPPPSNLSPCRTRRLANLATEQFRRSLLALILVAVVGLGAPGCDDASASGGDVPPGDTATHDGRGDVLDDGRETQDDLDADADTSTFTPTRCDVAQAFPAVASDLPRQFTHDPAAAARGADVLLGGQIGERLVPELGLANLWLVWEDGTRPDDYWAAFADRYGFVRVDGCELPLGVSEVEDGWMTFDCLTCHADMVAGEPVVGAGNSRVDLQGLYDDLVALNERAPEFGFPALPVPFELPGVTGAAGANDAFGMGMRLSTAYGPGGADINTEYGFQQAPAWWTMPFKRRLYTDGAGENPGFRTMMATTLAFGLSFDEIQAREADFSDLREFLLSLEPPAWPFEPPAADAVERGRALFDAECATCHGTHSGPDAAYPNTIVDVGTDPTRTEAFGEAEAAWVNASWFGAEHPMTAQVGYLAPPLVGVWATAPYLHNGSVPTLATLLDPNARPERWRRTGATRGDYDPEAGGWRYTEPVDAGDPATIDGRRTYDSTRPGLSNAGHTFGADLSSSERADILAYLKTL